MADNADQTKAIAELKAQVAILTKVVDRNRLMRHTPKDKIGKEIMISLYRRDLETEPSVVISWKLVRDDVRYTEKQGIEENQIVQITLAPNSAFDEARQQIKVLEGNLSRTKDEDKVKETEKKIADLESTMLPETVEMIYKDSLFVIEKEVVEVLGTTSRGGVTYFIVEHNGVEYNIAQQFIN